MKDKKPIKKETPNRSNFQFVNGWTGACPMPRGAIKIHGKVYGPRQYASFEISRKDAKHIFEWLRGIFK